MPFNSVSIRPKLAAIGGGVMTKENSCEVRLFGRPSLVFDGQNIAVPDKLLALLALLSASPASKISRSDAISKLWGASETHKANANFRQFLTRVKKSEKQIGAHLLNSYGPFLSYNQNLIQVDLEEILKLDIPKAIQAGDVETLDTFLGKTSGNFFDLDALNKEPFEDWKANMNSSLSSKTVRALIALLDSEHVVGLPEKREQLALRLRDTDPSQELAYRVLMEHYCEAWERDRARKIYQQCEKTLLVDYGVEPELSTRQLAASLGLTTTREECILVPRHSGPHEQIAVRKVKSSGEDRWHIGVPRIALLPPNLSCAVFATAGTVEALLDDITAGLTRYRSISVLAAHSARAAIQSYETSPMSIGERYGVQYIIKSSIRPSDGGDTANFLLLDCRTGASLAALNATINDDNLTKIFTQVVQEIVRQFVSAIERSEIELPSAAQNRTAYRYFLEGRRSLWNSDLPDLRRARSLFQKSIMESVRFAPAHAGVARTLSMERIVRGLTSTELLIKSLEFAETAIRLDPLDGRGLRERGFCNLYLRRHEESLRNFASAEAVNPNDADLLVDHADALAHSGVPEEARKKMLRAKSLNPDHPVYYNWVHASILYQQSEYDSAVDILSPMAKFPAVRRLLAASSAMAGDLHAARHHADVLKKDYPGFDLQQLFSMIPDKNVKDTKHLLEGLSRAGIR